MTEKGIILIVDDVPANIRVLAESLKNDYQVFFATDAAKAIELAQKQKPDLILMDVNMPGTNGFEACGILKSMNTTSDIPIIFLTAEANSESIIKGFQAGGVDYITKPFSKEELTARVKTHIELKKSRQKLSEYVVTLESINQSMNRDLEFARTIQSNLIPAKYPEKSGVDFHSFYHPMIAVGGDLFDVFSLKDDTLLGVFICDVSGHGVAAALIACMVKTLLITGTNGEMSPSQMCSYINGKLVGQTGGNFLTAFYGIYDIRTRMFRFTRCGHPYPLVLRNGEVIELKGKGGVIGVFGNAVYHENEIQLEAGDRVLFFTDGVLESADSNKVEFGEELLKDFFIKHKETKLNDTVDELYLTLKAYHGSDIFDDDIAVLGMQL
jgi:serine phosphatase RsbU (regulator of sigma subunit)